MIYIVHATTVPHCFEINATFLSFWQNLSCFIFLRLSYLLEQSNLSAQLMKNQKIFSDQLQATNFGVIFYLAHDMWCMHPPSFIALLRDPCHCFFVFCKIYYVSILCGFPILKKGGNFFWQNGQRPYIKYQRIKKEGWGVQPYFTVKL